NREFTEPKTVMLAYDGSESCKKALNMVASSPLFKGTVCHIVHVGDNGEELLSEASEVLSKVGIVVKTAQLSGKVEEVLAQYQRDSQIDLMMMGAFSHNRFRDFLLGSFTTKMLAATNRPLLLLR
ncbi:MAG: nucleotide-binding universal stress UspA family protein, partial [Enterobacterales bacterium]